MPMADTSSLHILVVDDDADTRLNLCDILELDDAQVAYSNAEAQRVSAQYDLATARARLAHALGRKQ